VFLQLQQQLREKEQELMNTIRELEDHKNIFRVCINFKA
jgi:hypothetical protein